MSFELGNTVSEKAIMKKGKPYYDWKVFVRLNKDHKFKIESIIESVTFSLHPTFPNPDRKIKAVTNNEFSMGTSGWGTFDIDIKVEFKAASGATDPIGLTHSLTFDHPGKWKTVKVPMSRKKL